MTTRPSSSHRRPLWHTALALAVTTPIIATSAAAQEEQAAAAAVRGQVRSVTGEPVVRATVELLAVGGAVVRTARADDAGRFRLTAPGPGRYRVRAVSIGYRARLVDVDVASASVASLDVVLETAPQGLSTLVTSATRSGQQLGNVPAAVSVISQDVIQATGRRNTNLEEALRTVPGLVIRDQLGGASRVTIAIRGAGSSNAFGVRSIRLLIDGIPKNNAGGSGQDLANLDMASVQSIEVLRGPASTLYGNQAGGVVAVTTEAGGEPRRQLQVLGGSYGFARVHGKATGEAFGGTVSYLGSAWRTQQEGYRANSNFDQTGFSSKLVYRPNERSTITGVMSYDNLGQDVSGALT